MSDQKKYYNSLKDAVIHMFFKDVVGIAVPVKLKKTTMLSDFCKNKKFQQEYVDMIVDRTERVFNVSIRRIKNKPVEEILAYIEAQKKKASMHRVY